MIIFTEGFDAYGTSNGAAVSGVHKWPSTSNLASLTVQDGRIQGKSVRFTNDVAITSPNFVEQTLTIGFGFRLNSTSTVDTRHFLKLFESSNLGINLGLTTSGELQVRMGTSVLATTTGLSLAAGNWHAFELSVTVHGSTGSYELRVDSNTVLSDSNIDTQPGSNAWTDSVRFEVPSGIGVLTFDLDDIYVRDDSTFLGAFKIATIFPNGDGAVDCTPSTGSDNFALVDENPANDDTDYVTGDAADADLYDYESLVDVSTIYAVAVNTVCRQTDASPLSVKLLAKSGSTTDDSAAQTIGSQNYVNRFAIWENNPDTLSLWTPSEVSNAQFGFAIE